MILPLRATPLPLSVQILEPDISHSAVRARKYLLQEDMTIKAVYLSRLIKTFALQDPPLLNGSTRLSVAAFQLFSLKRGWWQITPSLTGDAMAPFHRAGNWGKEKKVAHKGRASFSPTLYIGLCNWVLVILSPSPMGGSPCGFSCRALCCRPQRLSLGLESASEAGERAKDSILWACRASPLPPHHTSWDRSLHLVPLWGLSAPSG